MLVTRYFAKDSYKGKTVFVTGGGSGINLGVAKNFALCSAPTSPSAAALRRGWTEPPNEWRAFGAKVCAVAADVRDIAALQAAFATSKAELGTVDVLVRGAAGNFVVPADKLSAQGPDGQDPQARDLDTGVGRRSP
jgi:NAD(P)-dependent dehydrogenase (short-subunit alcohol dehydrogenase family)